MQRASVRDLLQAELGFMVDDDFWELLDEHGYVADAELTGSIQPLAAAAKRIRSAGSSRPKRETRFVEPTSGPSIGQERAWALSQLVRTLAEDDHEVVAFRAECMPDGLIPWSEFEAWLKAQVEAEGPITKDLTMPLPSGTEFPRVADGYAVVPPISGVKYFSVSVRALDYVVPGDEWVRRQAVAAGGVLDRLRVLAGSLADAFAWKPAQAAIFVVCGTVPFIAPVHTSTSVIKSRFDCDHPWARRIGLDIDPSATVQEVVDAYKQAQRKLGLDRLRALSLKHLRLAVFAEVDHADKPWSERHQLWNSKFPNWFYTHESNFRRDAARASGRIVGV